MIGPDRRGAWIACGGAMMVIVGTMVLLESGGSVSPVAGAVPSSTAPLVSPAGAVTGSAVGVNAVTPLLPKTWSKDDGMSVVARRYREAKDLHAFYERALQTGGSVHAYFASVVLARCQLVASQGRVGAEQRFASQLWSDGKEAERLSAYREWTEPCGGFEAGAMDSEFRKVSALLREAPGPLGDFLRPGMTADGARAILRAALEGGDPELIAAVSGSVVMATIQFPATSSKEESELRMRRFLTDRLAWSFAGCELGADCAKGSQVWFSACMTTGDCADGNYRNGYWVPYANMSAKDVPAILQRRDEILSAVRARNWDALP